MQMKEIVMENIKLIALDVDGTLTTGEIAYMEYGDEWREIKVFNAKDGLAMKTAVKKGLTTAIITGRKSMITERRGKELGVKYVYQHIDNKVPVLLEICEDMGINPSEVAYVGDDINDLSVMGIVGFSACPSDASIEVLEAVDFVSKNSAGKGAVREVIEIIMKVQGIWPV